MTSDDLPLEFIWYSLEEALELLTDLREAKDTLLTTRYLAGALAMHRQIQSLDINSSSKGLTEVRPMTPELLDIEDAAVRYNIPLQELLDAYYYATLPTVMVDRTLWVSHDAMEAYKRERDANGPSDPAKTAPLLPIGAAARLYDIPTLELVKAWFYKRIRSVKVNGIAFLPREAVEEYARHRQPQRS